MGMRLSSEVIQEGGLIPKRYTCDGENVSPPLSWSGLPEGTRSLALICEDPDAPSGNWVHWVLFNIPPDITTLEEGLPQKERLSDGSVQGVNDFHKVGYGGPCPPSGTHRYDFRLYALDTFLDLKPGAKKDRLLKAMRGHVIAEGRLTGAYRH